MGETRKRARKLSPVYLACKQPLGGGERKRKISLLLPIPSNFIVTFKGGVGALWQLHGDNVSIWSRSQPLRKLASSMGDTFAEPKRTCTHFPPAQYP